MQIPIRTFITYSRVYGRKIHHQTLKARLRKFDRTSLIVILCKINNLLYGAKWRNFETTIDIDEVLINAFISPDTREMPEFASAKARGDQVFHRQQILTLMRLAVLFASDKDSTPIVAGDPSGFALGECCLIVNDQFEPAKQVAAIGTGGDRKVRRNLGLQMAPSFELTNPARMDRAIARSDIIYSDILHSPEMKERVATELGGFDLESEFLKVTGLTLDDYRNFVYLLLTWYDQDLEDFLSGKVGFNLSRYSYVGETQYGQSQFDTYLRQDSVALSELGRRLREPSRVLPMWDFIVFRRSPLLELQNGTLLCVDPSFLLEKLSDGLFWTIFNSFKPGSRERDKMFQAFGYLFELYVDRIIKQMYPVGSGVYSPFPRLRNGNEASDGLIWLGDHLILLESKARFLKADAKYGGKMKLFMQELENKFIRGRNAGVITLANNIERLFHSDKSKRQVLADLPGVQRAITRVTPLMVVQEPLFRFDFLNEILNDAFQAILCTKNISDAVTISPLQVVDIESLERIRTNVASGIYRFDQCVNLRALDDRDLRSSFFTFMWLNYPAFIKQQDPEIEQRFDAVFKSIAQETFGRSPSVGRSEAGAGR